MRASSASRVDALVGERVPCPRLLTRTIERQGRVGAKDVTTGCRALVEAPIQNEVPLASLGDGQPQVRAPDRRCIRHEPRRGALPSDLLAKTAAGTPSNH